MSGYQSEVSYITETENRFDEKLNKEIPVQVKIPLDTILFAKRENGFLYQGDVSPQTIIQKQLTQTRVPGVYESYILNSPRIMYRYAVDDTIQSFFHKFAR